MPVISLGMSSVPVWRARSTVSCANLPRSSSRITASPRYIGASSQWLAKIPRSSRAPALNGRRGSLHRAIGARRSGWLSTFSRGARRRPGNWRDTGQPANWNGRTTLPYRTIIPQRLRTVTRQRVIEHEQHSADTAGRQWCNFQPYTTRVNLFEMPASLRRFDRGR